MSSIGNKTRKFRPTAGSHDSEIIAMSTHGISDVTSLTPFGAPLDTAPEDFDRRNITYGSAHEVFRATSEFSPSPTALPLFHTSFIQIGCCGYYAAEVPKSHLKRLIKLAFPAVIGGVLSVCMNLVNLAFVGHLSPDLLGGCALGNAFMLITGFTVLLGLCSAIDTLCSQAHGANQSRLVGLIAQRAATAYTLVCFPIVAMWYFTGQFFRAAGQDPTISDLAGDYVFWALPTIFAILYSEVIKRYLQAQSIIAPQIYVAIVANIAHAVSAYIFIFQLDYGIRGASYALNVGLLTQLFCWLIYLRFLNRRVYRRTCPRCKCAELFIGWDPLFRLGAAGMAMLLFEWMSFEICAIGAGWIGATELDTMVVFSNLCTFLTMAPAGIGIATSTLVGHAIGGGKHEHARLYSHAAAFLIICFVGVEFILLGSVRHLLARVFTSDPAVDAGFGDISICVAFFVICDGLQTVEGGVLRGVGLQNFGARANFVIFYVISLPIGFFLAFYLELGVPGLVIGLVNAVFTQTIVFFLRLSRIDWEEEIENAAKRIAEEQPHASILAATNTFGGYRTPSDVSSEGEDEDERADERAQYGFLQ